MIAQMALATGMSKCMGDEGQVIHCVARCEKMGSGRGVEDIGA